MGLPGSGKTYVADHLAAQGWIVVSGEQVAQEMFGSDRLRADQYELVYGTVRQLAAELLQDGRKVVIDGTNLKYSYRQQIYKTCRGFTTLLIYLTVDRQTALDRISQRVALDGGSDCSEETFSDFERQPEPPCEGENGISIKADKVVLRLVDKHLPLATNIP